MMRIPKYKLFQARFRTTKHLPRETTTTSRRRLRHHERIASYESIRISLYWLRL